MRDVLAIDVHAHYGLYRIDGAELAGRMISADAQTVARRARACGIQYTMVSPLTGLLPRGRASAVAGNEEAWDIVPKTDGLLQWVIVNPLEPQTYEQARRMLGQRKSVGIKLHPDEHCYDIREHGRAIFEFAGEQNAIVMTHSGGKRSMPQDFVALANDFPHVKVILAHLGGAWDEQRTCQVQAIAMTRHGNVFTDTSSSRSILSGLIEWAVSEIGADRILFGTDAPIYLTAVQRARIDEAEIAEADKRRILRENAAGLFADLLGKHE